MPHLIWIKYAQLPSKSGCEVRFMSVWRFSWFSDELKCLGTQSRKDSILSLFLYSGQLSLPYRVASCSQSKFARNARKWNYMLHSTSMSLLQVVLQCKWHIDHKKPLGRQCTLYNKKWRSTTRNEAYNHQTGPLFSWSFGGPICFLPSCFNSPFLLPFSCFQRVSGICWSVSV